MAEIWKATYKTKEGTTSQEFTSFAEAKEAFRQKIDDMVDVYAITEAIDATGDLFDEDTASNYYKMAGNIENLVFNHNFPQKEEDLDLMDYEDDIAILLVRADKLYVDASGYKRFPMIETNICDMMDPNKAYHFAVLYKKQNFDFYLEKV